MGNTGTAWKWLNTRQLVIDGW